MIDPLEKPKCIYKTMHETGNSTTFADISMNKDLQRCVVCDGYNENCQVYVDTRRFADKCHRMREEHKREVELSRNGYRLSEERIMTEGEIKQREEIEGLKRLVKKLDNERKKREEP